MCRQVLILLSLVGIIVGASVGIGYAVLSGGNTNGKSGTNAAAFAGANGENGMTEQQLLEIAERVIVACSETILDNDLTECQNLCHSSMCCFESGQYSCEDDESKACAVYAGCEALVEGYIDESVKEDS